MDGCDWRCGVILMPVVLLTWAPILAGLLGVFNATSAQAACNRQGRIEFPYGFNGHWILGKLTEEILDDRWFFKLEATVENEFGAKRKVYVMQSCRSME